MYPLLYPLLYGGRLTAVVGLFACCPRSLRTLGAGASHFSVESGGKRLVTEVGFEPTPEDQCLKLAP
jgi:hypothetical protein